MKWLGAILFLGVSSWVGFEWSRKFSKRPQHIRQLKNALQILEAEILYSQLPLRDAFLTISKQIPHPTRSFFSVLSEQMKDKDKRSEEHTSELQSRFDLVCRLLLEKKKIKKN